MGGMLSCNQVKHSEPWALGGEAWKQGRLQENMIVIRAGHKYSIPVLFPGPESWPPKVAGANPWNLELLVYLEKIILHMSLNERSWGGEMIWVGLNAITYIMILREGRGRLDTDRGEAQAKER